MGPMRKTGINWPVSRAVPLEQQRKLPLIGDTCWQPPFQRSLGSTQGPKIFFAKAIPAKKCRRVHAGIWAFLSVFLSFNYGFGFQRGGFLSCDFSLRHRNQRKQPITGIKVNKLAYFTLLYSKINLFLFSFSTRTSPGFILDRLNNVLCLCYGNRASNTTLTTTLDRDHLFFPNPACIHLHPPTLPTPNHPHPITFIIIQLYPTSASTLASRNSNYT